MWVLFHTDNFERSRQPLGAMFHKVLKVWTRHGYVYVIIPGNETTMTYSSQHRSIGNIIIEMVLTKHFVDSYQYLQRALL